MPFGFHSLRSRCLAGVAAALLAGAAAPALADATDDPLPQSMVDGLSPTGAYLAAGFASTQNDLGAAAQLMAVVLAHDPSNPRLLHRTFVLALSGGDFNLAVPLAREVKAVDDADQFAGLLLVLDELKAGDPTAALDRLDELGQDGIARYFLPLVESWIRAAAGERDAAVAALDELAATPGFGALALLHQGMILDWLGDLPAARSRYEAALEQGMSLGLVEALGSLYERTGDPAAAEALYARFLTGSPGNPMLEPALQRLADGTVPEGPVVDSAEEGIAESLFQIASALTQENAGDLALAYLRMALYMQPDLALGQILLGDILAERGELVKALAAYRSVEPGTPASWQARLSAAHTLDDLDRVDEAIGLLDDMAAERPDSSDPLIALADIHRGRERFKEAVAAYDRALERDPLLAESDWSFFYRRGIALERAGEWSRAEADLKRALELNPDHPHLLNYLGYSWIDRGENLAEAQAMIEQAVALMPNDGYIVDSLGWAYYRTGQAEKAVETLEQAAALQPDDPVINDHLGDAYWTVGRQNEAIFQWRRALSAAEPDERDMILAIEKKLANGLDKTAAVTEDKAAAREAGAQPE